MRHTIVVKIGATPEITGHVYIEAKNVKILSHERVEADGVIIDLPGDIEAILPEKPVDKPPYTDEIQPMQDT